MLISNEEAIKRLTSNNNLINKMKTNSHMSLFGVGRQASPEKVKTVDISISKKEIKDDEVIVTFNKTFNPFKEINISTSNSLIKEIKIAEENKHPTIDQLVNNNDVQIKLSQAHDSALLVLTKSLSSLWEKLDADEIKADKLPSVIAATSKVVESIRKERNEATKNHSDQSVHYHFYTPQQKKMSEYPVIDVTQ